MITEQDLQEAIAECQGDRTPNANTCIKLAAFYVIKDHLFPEKQDAVPPEQPVFRSSYAAMPEQVETIIDYASDTEFGKMIDGRKASEIWPIVDELVTDALRVVNPRLYGAFIRKLEP